MMLKGILRPTNRRVRLVVGLLIAGLFCIQCSRSEAFRRSRFVVPISGQVIGENDPGVSAEVIQLAKTDHIALLEYCLDSYDQRYRDYTCTLVKQERIDHQVTCEQEISAKCLEHPFGVVLAWTEQTAPMGDRVLYVEGKWGNQMLVRPKGLFGKLVGTVMRPPDGAEAMRSTLRPVNQFGFRRSLESLLRVYRQARQAGDLKEAFGGFAEVGGRKAVVVVRYLPPKDDYPSYKTVTFIDLEYLVPTAVEGYDWDNNLTSRYVFKDISFNVGLTVDDFLPAANDMKAPS